MTDFIIIGNHSAITYKEIFPYLKDNKMWLGYKPLGGEMYFHITDEYKEEIVKTKKEGTGWVEVDGEIMANVSQVCWFTNLEHSKRKDFIGLVKKYNSTDYPKYGNYDAIEVGRIENIPKDYDGVMGVPISFLGRHNPNQFEIVGCADADVTPEGWSGMSENFVKLYYEQGNTGSYKAGNRLAHYIHNGVAKVPFKRILIRKVKDKEKEL